jgi:hypothetical protein
VQEQVGSADADDGRRQVLRVTPQVMHHARPRGLYCTQLGEFTKYAPLRQRAGTQKVKRRNLLVQHVVDNNVFEKAYMSELRPEASATLESRKDCDEVTTPQKRGSVSPGSNVFRTSIDIGLASLDQQSCGCDNFHLHMFHNQSHYIQSFSA